MPIISLTEFIQNKMRMSQIYQPVMLKELLRQGGEATVEQIAKALLSYDQSQIEYYSIRTKVMVGNVLTKNGIVEPIKKKKKIIAYRLTSGIPSETQRVSLMATCDQKVREYINKRGDSIWAHRNNASGYVPGSIRYQVLKRAKNRCELCGAHEDQIALHVDHIIPRNKGGQDELNNFQALCMTCNTNKRDKDDTDFRCVLSSYNDREDGCLFCDITFERVIAQNELCYAIRDAFPVTEMHSLVIPKRHVADYFDLYQPELNAIQQMLQQQREHILEADQKVTGFNVGINSGQSAGQTINHCHVHLIPRRNGDVDKPRGGVRGVISDMQSY